MLWQLNPISDTGRKDGWDGRLSGPIAIVWICTTSCLMIDNPEWAPKMTWSSNGRLRLMRESSNRCWLSRIQSSLGNFALLTATDGGRIQKPSLRRKGKNNTEHFR